MSDFNVTADELRAPIRLALSSRVAERMFPSCTAVIRQHFLEDIDQGALCLNESGILLYVMTQEADVVVWWSDTKWLHCDLGDGDGAVHEYGPGGQTGPILFHVTRPIVNGE